MFNVQDNIAIKGVCACHFLCVGPGAVVKAASLESRDHGFESHSGLSSFKEKKSFFPAHSLRLILFGASVTERWRARPQITRARIWNTVSGGQCHFILILRFFLAQFSLYVNKGGLKLHSFIRCPSSLRYLDTSNQVMCLHSQIV